MNYWKLTSLLLFVALVLSVVYRPTMNVSTQDFVGRSPCSYMVFQVGTTTHAQDCETGATLVSSRNGVAVVQDAVGNLTSGGSIFLSPDISVDGQITITHSNITIFSNQKIQYITDTPFIRQIKIDASANYIVNIKIMGVATQELNFYANGNYIMAVDVVDCGIFKDTTYHGIIFQGDGSSNGWIDNVVVDKSVLTNYQGGDGATWGIVTWSHVRFVTQIVFTSDEFNNFGSDETMFLCRGDAQPDWVSISQSKLYTHAGTTGVRIFYQLTPTQTDYPVGFYFVYTNNILEAHTPVIFIEAQTLNNTRNMRLVAKVTGSGFSEDPGKLITFMVSADTDWGDGSLGPNLIVFEDNFPLGNSGIFTMGNLPSESSIKQVIVGNSPLLISLPVSSSYVPIVTNLYSENDTSWTTIWEFQRFNTSEYQNVKIYFGYSLVQSGSGTYGVYLRLCDAGTGTNPISPSCTPIAYANATASLAQGGRYVGWTGDISSYMPSGDHVYFVQAKVESGGTIGVENAELEVVQYA